MPFLSYRHAVQLRHELKDTRATIITPDEEEYTELISRWNEACEKEAVGCHSSPLPRTTLDDPADRSDPWLSLKPTVGYGGREGLKSSV